MRSLSLLKGCFGSETDGRKMLIPALTYYFFEFCSRPHKRGGKIKFAQCCARPCIEASTYQSTDAAGNPYPMGSWLTTDDRKVLLVIPRGY